MPYRDAPVCPDCHHPQLPHGRRRHPTTCQTPVQALDGTHDDPCGCEHATHA